MYIYEYINIYIYTYIYMLSKKKQIKGKHLLATNNMTRQTRPGRLRARSGSFESYVTAYPAATFRSGLSPSVGCLGYPGQLFLAYVFICWFWEGVLFICTSLFDHVPMDFLDSCLFCFESYLWMFRFLIISFLSDPSRTSILLQDSNGFRTCTFFENYDCL